jgi:hypothetical protein
VTQHLALNWLGPFAWPGFEATNGLPQLPPVVGVYLWTFQNGEDFVAYGAGITARRIAVRLREHTRKYLNGEYTVLDVPAARQGVRKEIWHGWGYARAHRHQFLERQTEITDAAKSQLGAFRIFVADPGHDRRLLHRTEAAIMGLLYDQPRPFSDLPDRGMALAGRHEDEPPIHVTSNTPHHLHGIPRTFDI